jgi:Bacterial SH3 domain
VSDRDGDINLRSAPNGSIIGRVSHQATVLYLESSSDRTWSHVITPQGEIGWIHSSRLAEISN